MVGLLATGLAFSTLAARESSLLFLTWLHAIAPGLLCCWLLFGSPVRVFQLRPAEA
jgi:hypothetical protein